MKIYEIKTQLFFDVDLRRNSGEEHSTCPKCSNERKKKNVKCFSWNHDKHVGRCSHCETTFVIKREMVEQKIYARPKFNNRTELSEGLVNWFFKRQISQQTLLDFKITEGMEFMPQLSKEANTMQFNYFRNDELVNVKYRAHPKHFKMFKDAELIMYNINSIKDCGECIITEGEMDAMSWHEAGYKNVVSVPNGASKNQKLEFLDNCFEYFEGKTKIYLSTDNDESGRLLREELARRLGYDRCFKIDFGDFKDANDYLRGRTKESLISLLNDSKEYPIEGVFTIDDNWSDIEDIYNNGLPDGDKTGDFEFDRHLRFMPGELTMITGIPGHGKSIFLDQISLGLCLNSNWNFGICSPESHPMAFYFTRLIKRLVGRKFSKYNISIDDLKEAKDWVKDRYNLIMPKDGFSLDEVLIRAKQLVLRKGIKGLIIDPWNRIENNMPTGFNESKWIVACLIKIINFAQQTGVHVFLVAHPTKMMKDKDGENFIIPNLYNISGSAHFFNMTQNGLTVFKNDKTSKTEIHIQKVKWEHLGKVGVIEYVYNDENARFYPSHGLNAGNWLHPNEIPYDNPPVEPKIDLESETEFTAEEEELSF